MESASKEDKQCVVAKKGLTKNCALSTSTFEASDSSFLQQGSGNVINITNVYGESGDPGLRHRFGEEKPQNDRGAPGSNIQRRQENSPGESDNSNRISGRSVLKGLALLLLLVALLGVYKSYEGSLESSERPTEGSPKQPTKHPSVSLPNKTPKRPVKSPPEKAAERPPEKTATRPPEKTAEHPPEKSSSLPNNVIHFLGRDGEIQGVIDQLKKSSQVVNIAGAPGFGKSALAVAVGHELVAQQGHVDYVDMAHKGSANDLISALNYVVNPRAGETDERVLLQWVKRLKNQHYFVVDNCDELVDKDRDSFLNFLLQLARSSNLLKILTTSQYKYNIIDIRLFETEIGSLTKSASVELLQRMSDQVNNSAARTLAALTGYAPLALKLIGGLLRDPDESVDDIIRELEQSLIEPLNPEHVRSEDRVNTSIETACRRLTPEKRVCFGALAVVDGNIEENNVAAILSATSKESKGCLKYLRRRSLIDVKMHKLVRAFILESNFQEKPSRDHKERFVRYYVTRFLQLSRKYEIEPLRTLKEFDEDNVNFHGMLLKLSSNAVRAAEAGRYARNLSIVGRPLIETRVPLARRVPLYQVALSGLSTDFQRSEDRCEITTLLAETLSKLHKERKHRQLLKDQKDFLRRCDPTMNFRLRIISDYCLPDYTLEVTESTLDCYWDLLNRLGLVKTQVKSARIVAEICKKGKHFNQAAMFFDFELLSPKARRDPDYEMDMSAQRKESRLEHSKETMKLSIKYLSSESEHLLLEDAKRVFPVGRSMFFLGIYSLAEYILREVIDIQTAFLAEQNELTMTTMISLGHVYFCWEKYENALAHYKKALDFFQEEKDHETKVYYLCLNIQKCYSRLGKAPIAKPCFDLQGALSNTEKINKVKRLYRTAGKECPLQTKFAKDFAKKMIPGANAMLGMKKLNQ